MYIHFVHIRFHIFIPLLALGGRLPPPLVIDRAHMLCRITLQNAT
jgi:hypothetical protein